MHIQRNLNRNKIVVLAHNFGEIPLGVDLNKSDVHIINLPKEFVTLFPSEKKISILGTEVWGTPNLSAKGLMAIAFNFKKII